jgi:uridine monophosphate synthetase
MKTFASILQKRVSESASLLCVGLDPHVADLQSADADSALEFCRRLVRLTAPHAAAFKPNAAFFEVFGAPGWSALRKTIETIREESTRLGSHIPVILDAKRGDIATTAEAYARAAFETLGADAITLSPYMGHDSIEPFLGYPERGVFVLCKTSNSGSADLQDVEVRASDGESLPLFLHVARLARGWNRRDNVGLVVGATYPAMLASIRRAAPDQWILVPGVGTQGGDLESALRAGLRADASGLLINISRTIARSADPAKAAEEWRERIELVREQRASTVSGGHSDPA